MTESPSYDSVEEVLGEVGAHVDAAQTQGILCGMFAAPAPADKAKWIAQVLADTQPRGEAARDCLTMLVALFEFTAEQMEDPELDFRLLLPEDAVPLAARARALGNWCSGFLLGLGLGELKQDEALAPEVGEALRDLGEIARIELEAAPEETNEEAYAELVEYVRMAALLVQEYLRPEPPKPSPAPEAPADTQPKTLH